MMFFWFIFVCCCLLGYCLALKKYFNVPIETTPFLIISTLITFLYIAAYLNILRIGALFVLISGAMFFLYISFSLAKEMDRNIIYQYLTPGLVIGGLFCFFRVLVACPIFTGWDSYSYWGPMTKIMFLNHGFINAHNDIFLSRVSYPPGAALFYYPFILIKYSEINVMRAQQLLYYAPLLLILRNIPWKRWYLVVSYGVGAYMLGYIFLKIGLRMPTLFWGTIIMDFPLAIFFASTIIYYQMSDKKTSDILRLLPCIFALSLLKIFSILPLVIVFILVDQTFIGFFSIGASNYKNGFSAVLQAIYRNKKIILFRLMSIILIVCCALIAFYSWKFYSIHIHVGSAKIHIKEHLTLSKIFNVVFGRDASLEQKMGLKHFIHVAIRPLFVSFIFLIGFIFVIKMEKLKSLKKLLLVNNIMLFLASLIYLFGLLILYLFAFRGYCTQALCSFDRYVNIYYLAWFLILYSMVFHILLRQKSKFIRSKWQIISILFALIIISLAWHHAWGKLKKHKLPLRRVTNEISDAAIRYIPLSNKVRLFVVWEKAEEPITYLRYNLVPVHMKWLVSVFPRYANSKSTPKRLYQSPELLMRRVSKNDYLLLAYTDQVFWKRYANLFPVKPPQLVPFLKYKICVTSGLEETPMGKNCHIKLMKAYLLKIKHENKKVVFENVVKQAEGDLII
jgi:hypothetical protein